MNQFTSSSSSAVSITEFAATLPAEYRERFNPAEIAVHTHIVSGRHSGKIAAGLFPWRELDVSAICVSVEDRPGLLAVISSALAQVGFDVQSAEAYCRSVPGGAREALDVFWLRDPDGRISHEEVSAFAELLQEVLDGRREALGPVIGLRAPSEEGTTVRFLENSGGNLTVLEVETQDRSGLLWVITRALHQANVQIVGSQIRTEGVRVLDRFTIEEIGGQPISNERRLEIQVAVLSAVEI